MSLTTGTPVGSPWAHPDYRRLVTGSSISALGNAVTPVALAFAVLDLGGTPTQLGLVIAVFAVAEVLTTLFGGVIGDRVPRRIMMELSSFAACGVGVLLGVSLLLDIASIASVAALGGLSAVLVSLGRPSSRAMTRLTVPSPLLSRAVAMRTFLQTGAMTFGYALGGVLVAGLGPGWAVLIDAATFAVAGCCFALLRVEQPPVERGASVLADLGDGFREVGRHAWLWLLIGQATLYHFLFGGAQQVLGPVVVGEGIGRSAWGLTMASLMAGFVAGSAIALRWRPRRGLFVGCCLLCLTFPFPITMALSTELAVIVVAAFVHGFGLQLFDYFWDLSIQQHVPEDKLARVYSLDLVGSFIARPAGLALTGPLAAWVGTKRWLIVVGVTMAIIEVGVLASREVRGLTLTTASD